MLGVTISHYRVTEKLGSGGMGDVYAARDLLLGRTVAIKVLQSHPDGDGLRRQRFLQEARAASALNHPSIVTISDVVQENDVDYIVMELVEGETLAQRMVRAGLSLDESLDLMKTICSGLALAHARGIVHRDLKPGNIMIPSTGGVKILDFGLAKFAGAMMSGEEAGPTAQRTRPGELLALQPDDQHFHGDLGVLYYVGARYDEAASAFQKSIDLAPDNVAGYRNLGAVLHQKGDYPGAARILQRSLEIRQDSSVYSNLGTLYFFQGLHPQSVTAFEKAVANGANDFMVWSNLGDAYRWTPENEAKARDAFSRSLQLLDEKLRAEPDSAELLSRRALVLAKKGDREPALLGANALEDQRDHDPQILYRLALTYELAGARERAIEQLDLAIARGYSTEELRKDPELAKLRSDVRYHKMMIAHK